MRGSIKSAEGEGEGGEGFSDASSQRRTKDPLRGKVIQFAENSVDFIRLLVPRRFSPSSPLSDRFDGNILRLRSAPHDATMRFDV